MSENIYGLYVEKYCVNCDFDKCKMITENYKVNHTEAPKRIKECAELKQIYKEILFVD